MVRQLNQRVAAHSPKVHKPTRPSRAVPVPKSPLASRGFHAKHARRLASAPNVSTSRYLKSRRPVLPTILEEDDDEEVYTRPKRDLTRELDALEQNDDTGADDMDWDEESTLVALLRDDVSEHSDTEDLAALADRLKAPMAARSQQLKRHIAETIVPAVKRVMVVHDKLDDQVDMAYGTGLLAFDEVCKRVESMALRSEDEIRSEYIESKKAVDSLLAQLSDAYQARDALWTQLDEDLASCADRAKAAIEALPGDVENTIARLEKKSKDLEKNANSASSKQKILKGLLERL